MAALDDLISRVGDAALRTRLRDEAARLRSGRRFGLVFEEHLPEVVADPRRPLTEGSVAVVDHPDPSQRIVAVRRVEGDEAVVAPATRGGGDEFRVALADLVAADDLDSSPLVPVVEPVGECLGPGAVDGCPRHLLIEAENHHALRLLSFTHAGKVDCVYIDPPYNTGATDWVYNNRFVDAGDGYRHSVWLSMMQRRLRLARRLLKPDGVLIVTIDECEVHRLALLLEQMFPDAEHQMVTVMILPQGNARATFTRVDEHALFCFFGDAEVCPWGDDLLAGMSSAGNDMPSFKPVQWKALQRAGNNSRPRDRPGLCYPVFIDDSGRIVGTGRTLAERADAGEIEASAAAFDGYEPAAEGRVGPAGMPRAEGIVLPAAGAGEDSSSESVRVLWPRDSRGRLSCWGLGPSTLLARVAERRVQVNEGRGGAVTVSYLTDRQAAQIEAGEITLAADDPGRGPYRLNRIVRLKKPMTMWNRTRHVAGGPYGTTLLDNLLGGKRFDFPKSLYSTLDAVAAVVADRPDAVVLDFFAGSGTTLHATALLNLADGGSRQCIAVTNNEVGRATDKELRSRGLRPGDDGWEANGVCRNVTWPRITAALTGRTPSGDPVPGKYLPVPFGPQLDPSHEPHVHGRDIAAGLPQAAAYLRLGFAEQQQFRWHDDAGWPQGLATMWLASGCHGPAPARASQAAAAAAGTGWLLPAANGPIGEGCRFAVLLRPAVAGSFARALSEPAAAAVTHIWVVARSPEDSESARSVITAARPDAHVREWREEMLTHFGSQSRFSRGSGALS